MPPAALLATAVGLVFLALAAVLDATRSQTHILRRYLARLIAVIPSVVLAAQISGFVLSVPWWQLGVLAAATYAAALLAAVLSAHKLRVTEARAD